MTTSVNTSGFAVELHNVNKTFGHGGGQTHVLHNISLQLPKKAGMVFVMGPSGCGKTTLISIIAGILSADEGSEIRVFGQSLHTFNERQMVNFRQERLGFIFQQFQLVPTITVLDNVAIPLLIRNEVSRKQAYDKAQYWLEKVGLGKKAEQLPRSLSGGQQQRVAIARSLISEPSLLICDEPTSSLDGTTGMQVMELLQELGQDSDRLMIIVTHDSRIEHFADWRILMEDGQICSKTPVSHQAQQQERQPTGEVVAGKERIYE